MTFKQQKQVEEQEVQELRVWKSLKNTFWQVSKTTLLFGIIFSVTFYITIQAADSIYFPYPELLLVKLIELIP